jgi:hypothetical protein
LRHDAGDAVIAPPLEFGQSMNIVVNWSGVRNGKSRRSIERATEEIKRFAPKQRAMVSSAAVIRPELLPTHSARG